MPVKIVWDFKKSAHFEENYSESPMHRIGYFDWTLFIDDETLRVRCVPHASDSFGLVHEVEAFGTVILKGVDVRDDEEYDWNVITAGNITIATYANFGLDSFDRKFLHPGGIYRIETTIHITRGYCVDFCSPNNPFIGERSNAVRIVVEGHGFYVSKSHLGTMIPYFKARFRYDAQTVDDEGIALEGVDAETFCEFLKMLYPLKAHENCFFGCIRDVLIFADRMCCDIVLQRSQEILMRRKFFDVETLELADMYNLEQLRSVALQEMPRRELERYRKKYGGRPECERTLKLLGKELEARDAKRDHPRTQPGLDMLDGRNVAVDREDIFQQQLELIETLAKEKDDLQVKLIDQIQVCAKLEYLLMVETEKGERQSERQQKTILQLLEEKQAMMEEMQKLKSPMDVQANNDDQSSADVKRELVDLQLVNSSLKEENHRLQMETQDLRRRLEEQSRSLESLSQKTVTVTPRQYRKVPKTNPNIRTCQLQTQQIHSFQTPPEEPQLQIPRRFVAKLRKDVRRSVPNLHFIEEERPVGTTKEKSKKGLLKRLSLRLVSPNIARE